MITKNDAIAIGKALVAAGKREKDNNYNEQQARWTINGVLHIALQNLWFDVLPQRTKEQFGYNSEHFIQAVWEE
jgi:hypothetical protein